MNAKNTGTAAPEAAGPASEGAAPPPHAQAHPAHAAGARPGRVAVAAVACVRDRHPRRRTSWPRPRPRSSTTPTARPRWTASPTRRQPRVGAAVQGARARAGRRDRGRGPRLLPATTASAPTGIARAVVHQRSAAAPTQGGSTITQQYVKNYYLTQDQTAHPQGQGVLHLRSSSTSRSPRTDPRGLPQHHLLRPRRLRHPGRLPGLLRQGRHPAHRPPRAPLLASVINAARATTTPPSATSRRRTPRPGSTTSSTAWWPRAG